MSADRGQAVTLEAIVAGLVLVSSVVFALQMTAVTPLSASTSSQHIENQLEASADGVLAVAVENGSLRRTILYFNETDGTFVDSSYQGYYAGQPPDTVFGRTLRQAFDERGVAYNVYVTYGLGGEDRQRQVIYRGQPSDNAVRTTTTVTLTDDARLYNHSDGDGVLDPRPVNVSSTGDFYMADQSETRLYDVATVEVVLWRI